MASFIEQLQASTVMVADGATGTNYQARGLPPGMSPEAWVFEQPERVLGLHRDFIAAGSDLILTCTFGASGPKLRGGPYAGRVAELNRRAAELACQAAEEAPRAVYVAGSLGPTGLLPEPYGPLGHAEAVDGFAEQAAALAEGGVDVLVLETFYALEEATAALEGVRQASDLPLICSFSYDRGTHTMMGVGPAQMAAALAPLGVAALGANCGTTLENMERIVAELAAQKTGLPLWAKPNAGVPQGTPPRYEVSPETMARAALHYIDLGARVVGGCCGSTPAHVRAIAQAVHEVQVPTS